MTGRRLAERVRSDRSKTGSSSRRAHHGRTRVERPAWAALGTVAALGACVAADVGAVDGWVPQASLSLGMNFTDNVMLAPRGQAEADITLRTAPTLQLARTKGRLKANAVYTPVVVGYVDTTRGETLFNGLHATGSFEALDDFAFVDAKASIQQTFISPFGAQPSDVTAQTANRTEMRTVGLSPYVKGRLGGGGSYLVRHDLTLITSSTAAIPETLSNRTSLQLSGDPGRFFIPATDYSYAATQYGSSPAYVNQIGRVRITAKFDKEFSAFLSGGYESYNLITSTRSGAIYGGGFNWQPQTRTTLSASIENRYYGNSFNVSGSHQTRLSTWKLHASRTDQQLPDRLPESSTASARQTLNELLRFTIPDPTARAQEVERLLQAGVPGLAGQNTGFLTTRVNLVKSIEPSVAITGVRNTLTFSAFRRETTPLSSSAVTTVGDPFLNVNGIRQIGWSIFDSWQLTEHTSVFAGLDRTRSSTSRGTVAGGPAESANQETYRVGLTHRLGSASTLNGTFRIFRVERSGTPDVLEHALLLTFTHNFYR